MSTTATGNSLIYRPRSHKRTVGRALSPLAFVGSLMASGIEPGPSGLKPDVIPTRLGVISGTYLII